MKDTAEKQQLNLTVNTDVVKRARDLKINISDITEKVLRAFTASSETADKEKLYEKYQELFKLMLPLLKKFRVKTLVAQDITYDYNEENWQGLDPDGQPIGEPDVVDVNNIYLQPDGKIFHDGFGECTIKNIQVQDFFRPQIILDDFLKSIQEGVEYRKNQFKEIEMAKTIIDAITKGTLSQNKKVKGR